jgi:hypothetical protein
MQLRFNCHECDDRLKRERGCAEKGIVPFDVGDERVFRCPLKLVTDQTWKYIEAYNFYKKNLLPNGQSYTKETRKYIDAMMVLDGEYAKLEEAELKKVKK